jgi:hypothetical protein
MPMMAAAASKLKAWPSCGQRRMQAARQLFEA